MLLLLTRAAVVASARSFGLPCALAAFSYSVKSVLMIAVICFFVSGVPPSLRKSAKACVLSCVPVERKRTAVSISAGVFLETSGCADVSTLAVFAGVEARALSRALAFAKTLFQSRSFIILPIDALVGLFQLPPMLSFHCSLVVTVKPHKNTIATTVKEFAMFFIVLSSCAGINRQVVVNERFIR